MTNKMKIINKIAAAAKRGESMKKAAKAERKHQNNISA